MTFSLSAASQAKLVGVHSDLVRVVHVAITLTSQDFGVSCGLRTVQEQEIMVRLGKSQTMNSRHLTGHAVDLFAVIGGHASWDEVLYDKIAAAMKLAATAEQVPIEWGGNWRWKDRPHFQLPWKDYPKGE